MFEEIVMESDWGKGEEGLFEKLAERDVRFVWRLQCCEWRRERDKKDGKEVEEEGEAENDKERIYVSPLVTSSFNLIGYIYTDMW